MTLPACFPGPCRPCCPCRVPDDVPPESYSITIRADEAREGDYLDTTDDSYIARSDRGIHLLFTDAERNPAGNVNLNRVGRAQITSMPNRLWKVWRRIEKLPRVAECSCCSGMTCCAGRSRTALEGRIRELEHDLDLALQRANQEQQRALKAEKHIHDVQRALRGA